MYFMTFDEMPRKPIGILETEEGRLRIYQINTKKEAKMFYSGTLALDVTDLLKKINTILRKGRKNGKDDTRTDGA